jgi:DNA-binding XRE family transcriptional regulator
MDETIKILKNLLAEKLPQCAMEVDAPEQVNGNWWLDVKLGRKHHTLEFRPGKGFGLFHKDAGYGEGPAEIYRTPQRVAQRLVQLMTNGKSVHLNLKELRELYQCSQVELAKKAGVKQSAISRLEKRDVEVKLATLAAKIKALGGKLEVRAHFPDADVPISFLTSKG